MSTNVPPHNLGEVMDATIHLIENPECAVADLMEFVKGPDFPTGAEIVGREAIHSAYTTGRGRVRMRAELRDRGEPERGPRSSSRELPYQQNKAQASSSTSPTSSTTARSTACSDLRDESDRDGIRIVIELKRGALADVVENHLLDTLLREDLQHDQPRAGGRRATGADLKQIIGHYLDHRREVVRRRTELDLDESEDRAHILEGRLTRARKRRGRRRAHPERRGPERGEGRPAGPYDLSERQANHIVRMQLGSLTSIEVAEIEDEYEDVEADASSG